MRLAAAFLTLSLVSACTPVGDYCDIYRPVRFDPPVAAYVLTNDEQAARTVAGNNAVFGECP